MMELTQQNLRDLSSMSFCDNPNHDCMWMEIEEKSNGKFWISIDGNLKHSFTTFSAMKRRANQLIEAHNLTFVENQWA